MFYLCMDVGVSATQGVHCVLPVYGCWGVCYSRGFTAFYPCMDDGVSATQGGSLHFTGVWMLGCLLLKGVHCILPVYGCWCVCHLRGSPHFICVQKLDVAEYVSHVANYLLILLVQVNFISKTKQAIHCKNRCISFIIYTQHIK